jgi:hypothetical protein
VIRRQKIGEDGINRWATFSDDLKFRYELGRSWVIEKADSVCGCGRRFDAHHGFEGHRPVEPLRVMTVLGQNPSNADEKRDDPTATRCMGFARREGMNALRMVNPFARIFTKPRDLIDAAVAGEDIVGPENDEWIGGAFATSRIVVIAHGALKGPRAFRELFVRRVGDVGRLAPKGKTFCLGRTLDGEPRHPLYLRADTPLEPWSRRKNYIES